VPSWEKLNNQLLENAINHFEKHGEKEYIEELIQLRSYSDQWQIGTCLKKNIPKNLYTEWVRKILGVNNKVSRLYSDIWSFDVLGAINYNLDQLLELECSIPTEFISTPIDGKFKRNLVHKDKWVFHPHGHLSQPDSWVLTSDARNELLRNTAYTNFMNSASSISRFVFLGFQPSDFSY
jgi:hypothetical protein